MEFEELLRNAKAGDLKAKEQIFLMYQPLLTKHSIIDHGEFDEDLYQELSRVLLDCIRMFKFS